MKLHPTAKLAKSPTKAVEVPFKRICKMTFNNSTITPAAGPNAKPQINTGISLKSSL